VSHTATAAPVSARLVDAACAAFALWTLCSHAVVARSGTLRDLLALYALAGAAGVAAWGYRRRRRAGAAAPAVATERPPPGTSRWRAIVQGVAIVAGTAAVVAGLDAMPVAWWWTAVLGLGAAAAVVLVEAPRVEGAGAGRAREASLWAMAGLGVVVTLVCHRPDIDDAFYVNVAVSAADAPDQALLRFDTLLGNLALPVHQPAYLVHSYELWNGALAYLTGIPAIYCFHWISASVAALLVPLASARLFRLLTPRIWPASVAVLVGILLAAGETHRWYGNFAFVRMWQGKSIYLFVFLPLIYAYALRFALQPTWGRWLWLAAAQVAAVGCTSSAIWAGPAAALAAMSCALRPSPRGLAILVAGGLASLYPLGAGWLLKGELQTLMVPLLEAHETGTQLADALAATLGPDRLRGFGMTAILIAWACCPRGLAQRFAIVVPLAVALVILNPYWDTWIGANLTGPSYWRALWSVPVPTLMTLVLVAPLHWNRGPRSRIGGRLGCLALFALFAAAVPRYGALSPENGGAVNTGLRLGWPGPKVPADAYRWAALLNESVPAGAQVVAPPDVSVWVPTFHHPAHPVEVRPGYLYRHRERLGAENVRDRRVMTLYAAGIAAVDDAPEIFRRGLDRFSVQGVCLRNGSRAAEARAILRQAGFRRKLRATDREIWVRP
jgi:hypothetical protein